MSHRPTAIAAVAQLQQLPQVQRQTRFLWETPEVTTAASLGTINCRPMRSLWEKPELCDGSDAVGQLTNGLPELPLSRLSHGSSISHRIGVEFQISTQHKTPY